YCMANGLDSLILGVDNRSLEISKDINLPVIARDDFQSLQKWLDGKQIFDPVELPLADIEKWKDALREVGKVKHLMSPSSAEGAIRSSEVASVPRGRPLLNLGCGGRYHPAWINVDFTATGPGVVAHDLMQPLEFDDDTFDAVYHSHVLEHMPKRYAPVFLGECLRVLKPGGILRVVVPDLESAAQEYLQQLQKAKNGDQVEIARLEYLTINLIDQMVRHRPGGELLNYWKQNPMPDEDFAVQVHGIEIVRALAVLRDPASSGSQRVMDKKFDYAIEYSAKPVGHFRTSGESHLWMYDSVSLKQLLLGVGFSEVNIRRADESSIDGFNSFNLDILNDGSVAKPDSIFLEGIK
ncbi:MAG: methyltransferase domain-containing protein, partial [Desulfobulbaceae bacterium]|nr:methyltransferase domain-containing protein [Desulfobulbaceae bacterium]